MSAFFFAAIAAGDLLEMRTLLTQDPSLAQATNEHGISALMWALYHRQPESVTVLRKTGLVLNGFEAAAVGDTDRLADLLRDATFSVNEVSPDGFTALGFAAFFGRLPTLVFLLEHGAAVNQAANNPTRVYPIHSAVAHGNPEIALKMVQRLLEARAEVNVAQQGGWTPLHQAAAHGRTVLAQLLLNHGADPTIKSEDGQTPYDMAMAKNHTATTDLLESLTN